MQTGDRLPGRARKSPESGLHAHAEHRGDLGAGGATLVSRLANELLAQVSGDPVDAAIGSASAICVPARRPEQRLRQALTVTPIVTVAPGYPPHYGMLHIWRLAMPDDRVERPTPPVSARPTKPADIIERGWDLVDTTPPPQAQATPPSPPPTSAPAVPSSGTADDGSSGSE